MGEKPFGFRTTYGNIDVICSDLKAALNNPHESEIAINMVKFHLCLDSSESNREMILECLPEEFREHYRALHQVYHGPVEEKQANVKRMLSSMPPLYVRRLRAQVELFEAASKSQEDMNLGDILLPIKKIETEIAEKLKLSVALKTGLACTHQQEEDH